MHVKDLHLYKQEREEGGRGKKTKKLNWYPNRMSILLESFLLQGRKVVFNISGHLQ